MFRARETRQLVSLTLALATLAFAGCIFSPKKIDKPPVIKQYVPIVDEKTLVSNLEAAYQRRDYNKFKTLFSNPTTPIPAEPTYQFLLSEPQNNETAWGYPEEMRIHRRMFRPEDPQPGETPVAPELWLQSVDITLTQQTDFVERTDLYKSPSNPSGLDPVQWSATEGTYVTYVFFQLAGNTDYQVNGHANFVVIQDKTKTNADPGKWLLYRWEDLLHKPSAAKPAV
jgi:hypothetical protein